MARSHERLTLLLIVSIGLVLRAYRLDFQSLWIDEVITYKNSIIDLSSLILNPRDVNGPPLYYFIIHLVLRLGDQDFLLRLPSAILGSFSISLFYFILRNWFERTIAIAITIVMTISPFHIWYSQEARPYALLLFLSLLSFYFLIKLIKDQKNLRLKFGFILSMSAFFYCHVLSIAFIGFVIAYIMIHVPQQKWANWLPSFGSVALLIAPGIYQLLISPSDVPSVPTNYFRSFDPSFIAYVIWSFSTGYSLGPTLQELHMPGRMGIVSSHLHIIVPIVLFFSSFSILGAFQLYKRNNLLFLSIALWFLLPLVLAILGTIFTVHSFNIRYTILSFPPFIIFLIIGTHSLRFNWMRTGTFGIICTVSILSLVNYYFDPRYHRDDNRSAGQYLSAHALPHDIVIANAPYTVKNILYYYHGDSDIRVRGYPLDRDFDVLAQNNALNSGAVGALHVKPGQLRSDLEAIIGGQERFWLFLSRTYHSDPKGYLRKFLDEQYCRDVHASWPGTELFLYHTNMNPVCAKKRAG